MSDLDNPIDWGRRDVVYKWDQVITHSELHGIRNGFIHLQKSCKWWEFKKKKQYELMGIAIQYMILWIKDGKPVLGVNL